MILSLSRPQKSFRDPLHWCVIPKWPWSPKKFSSPIICFPTQSKSSWNKLLSYQDCTRHEWSSVVVLPHLHSDMVTHPSLLELVEFAILSYKPCGVENCQLLGSTPKCHKMLNLRDRVFQLAATLLPPGKGFREHQENELFSQRYPSFIVPKSKK